MSNPSTPSYTGVTNANLALGRVLDVIDNFDTVDDFYESLCDEEKQAFRSLTRRIEEFTSMVNDDEEMLD